MMKKEIYLKPTLEVVKMMDELCDAGVQVGSGGSEETLAPKRKSFDEDESFSLKKMLGHESDTEAEAASWE